MVIDPFSVGSILRKKHRLMACNCKGKLTIGQRLVCITGIVETNQIVPVPGKAFAPTALLKTENVYGCGFFQKSTLGQQHGSAG